MTGVGRVPVCRWLPAWLVTAACAALAACGVGTAVAAPPRDGQATAATTDARNSESPGKDRTTATRPGTQPVSKPGVRTKTIRRAAPRKAAWDRATLGVFRDDAFTELVGARPDFNAVASQPAAGAGGPVVGNAAAAGTGFRWSTLVSEETLTDEVKDMKALLAQAVASPSAFKGGGYEKARDGFSAVALAFGVIAAYDQEIRWQKDAAAIRDLFARVGFNCKVGTDQSFGEAKLRVADLGELLDGTPPTARADRDEDFRWSQVAARPALMSRLEAADERLGAAISSAGGFEKALEQLRHDAEIVAAIGEAIRQPDYEYHDDQSYLGHAAAMRDAAVRARDAVKKKDYDAARSAVGDLKKSCDSCHGDFRG
jgi:hypothetical protein